jgi:hypothetical protein
MLYIYQVQPPSPTLGGIVLMDLAGTIKHAQLAAVAHNREIVARYRAQAKMPGPYTSRFRTYILIVVFQLRTKTLSMHTSKQATSKLKLCRTDHGLPTIILTCSERIAAQACLISLCGVYVFRVRIAASWSGSRPY